MAGDKKFFEKKTYEDYIEDPLGLEYRKNQVKYNHDIRINKVE